ncbi:hypothetical protein GCM10027452_06980 [Micromonospora halotolerans]
MLIVWAARAGVPPSTRAPVSNPKAANRTPMLARLFGAEVILMYVPRIVDP